MTSWINTDNTEKYQANLYFIWKFHRCCSHVLHCYCELRAPPLKPSDWQLCSACNSVGGSALWGGCHWYPLCNFLLAGGWWLWLNLGFSPCHQHYCAGIPRVPALRILCHILSCQLWTLPAGPVARHNTDYLSPKRPLCLYAMSLSLSFLLLSHPPSLTISSSTLSSSIRHFICLSLLPFSRELHLSITLCRSAVFSHWRREKGLHQVYDVICVGELRGC